MAARTLIGEEVLVTDTPLVQDIVDTCRRCADRVYLKDARSKQQLTFQQYLDNASSISLTLRSLEQGPGKIVSVFSDTTMEAMTMVLGIWLSGAASSCVNPSLPKEEMTFFLKTCRSEVIFCGEDCLDQVEEAAAALDWPTTIVCPGGRGKVIDFFGCLRDGGCAEGLALEGRWSGKDQRIAVMFTSGTTGVPKGVAVRDLAIKFNVAMKNYTEKSRLALTTPMYWISNTLTTAISTCCGCEVLIAAKMPLLELLKTITVYKPTEWFTGPAVLIDICQLENLEDYDFSCFETLSVGGSALLPEHRSMIIRKMLKNRKIVRMVYGSTEAGIVALDSSPLEIDLRKMASVGKVAMGTTLKIVNTETGDILPPMAVGEICAKSPGVLKEYINKDLTEEELDRDGFWHMGDLGYYDEEGYIYYTSRMKDVMKYRGQQIAPAELETILLRHPDVVESCVVGKTCLEQGGDLPAAFVVKRVGSTLTEEELYTYISDNVIDEKKLRGGIYFVESLPKSAVGKVLRYMLQKQLCT